MLMLLGAGVLELKSIIPIFFASCLSLWIRLIMDLTQYIDKIILSIFF